MVGTDERSHGGIASVVSTYRSAGLYARWPVIYLTTHQEAGVGTKLCLLWSSLSQFLRLLVRRRVALVHLHCAEYRSFYRKSLFAALARGGGVPYLAHLHGRRFVDFYTHSGPLGRFWIRATLRHAAQVVVLSPEWEGIVQGLIPGLRTQVIPNPVLLPEQRTAVPAQAPRTLVFLAALIRDKGIHDLLAAFTRVGSKYHDARLICAGEGEVAELQTLAEQLGIADQVSIRRWVQGEAKEILLQTAYGFVLPSYYEGLPISLLEAMAYGLPVIATRVGGIPSALDDGVEGWLIDAGKVDQLTAALDALLSDPAHAARMGDAGRARVANEFSAAVALPPLEALYRRYLQPGM